MADLSGTLDFVFAFGAAHELTLAESWKAQGALEAARSSASGRASSTREQRGVRG